MIKTLLKGHYAMGQTILSLIPFFIKIFETKKLEGLLETYSLS